MVRVPWAPGGPFFVWRGVTSELPGWLSLTVGCVELVLLGVAVGLSLRVLFWSVPAAEAATLHFSVSLNGFMTLIQFFFWLINKQSTLVRQQPWAGPRQLVGGGVLVNTAQSPWGGGGPEVTISSAFTSCILAELLAFPFSLNIVFSCFWTRDITCRRPRKYRGDRNPLGTPWGSLGLPSCRGGALSVWLPPPLC